MINYLDMKLLKIYNGSTINMIINPDNKYKNSVAFLLTPNYDSTLRILNSTILNNRKYIQGYYFEPGISYYVTENSLYYDNEDLLDIVAECEEYSLLNEDTNVENQPTTSTGPTQFRNPTKPRVKSKTIDGKKIVPTKKTANPNRDPKSLMRHLRYDMRRAKYKLNKISDPARANIGGNVNNQKALDKTKELMNKGKTKEINRKKREEYWEKVKNGEITQEFYTDFSSNTNDELVINEDYIQLNDVIIFSPEYITENNSNLIKRMLYQDRIISQTQALKIFKRVKVDTKNLIKIYHSDLNKYRQASVFYDLSYYNEIYFKNNIYSNLRGLNIYGEFLSRQLNNKAFNENGYTNKVLIIPVDDWVHNIDQLDFKKDINPISLIYRALKRKDQNFLSLFNFPILFVSESGIFKADFNDTKFSNTRCMMLLNKLVKYNGKYIPDNDEDIAKPDNIDKINSTTTTVVNKLEDKTNIKINSNNTKSIIEKPLPISTNKTNDKVPVSLIKNNNVETRMVDKKLVEKEKEETINTIIKDKVSALNTTNSKEVIDSIDISPEEKTEIIKNLRDLEKLRDNNVKTSTARSKRMDTLEKGYTNLTLGNKKISEILNSDSNDELQSTDLTEVVESPNTGWSDLKFINFEKSYNEYADLANVLKSLSENKTYPVFVRDIKAENTSTTQDYRMTYTIALEDKDGKRSTMKMDLPIVEDGFMLLKGNKKTMQKQIAPIPVCKINNDTSQITTNYMKVTISTFGGDGKSFKSSSAILKVLRNPEINLPKIKTINGDVSSYYSNSVRPIDFLDLTQYFTQMNIDNKVIIEFDIHKLKQVFPDTPLETDDHFMYGYTYINNKKTPLYYKYSSDIPFSTVLGRHLMMDSEFLDAYNKTVSGIGNSKYSRAKILQINIPVIILCCLYEGLEAVLNKAKISYTINNKRDTSEGVSNIVLKDMVISYKDSYEASMLLNGMNSIKTKDYTLAEMNTNVPYMNYINDNGFTNKVDGLMNFYDLMMDPITVSCCEKYDLPKDYVSMLIYASNLLVDNKFVAHTDMNGRRIRSTEIISGYIYLAIAKAYQEYSNQKRRGRDVGFTMKQSAVIDLIMLDPTFSDMPQLNDLQIFEAMNAISYKGLSGMNNERSYSLDKRAYDPSMINIIGMATGFAGNVGINRQLTIDPNIESARGYTKTANNASKAEKDLTKTFTMTEAIASFAVTRNDTMRSAMNFIQTSSHSMRVSKGSPCLVTSGADQALAYVSDNTFAHKSKDIGIVKEITDDYMILEYKNGKTELVDLSVKMLKNSNGGFYTSVHMIPKVKKGQKIYAGTIVAYDKNMYSDDIGNGDTLSYKLGTLTKIAILNTEEGFEDSGIISETLSEQMTSNVVELKTVTLSKNTNILNMVNIGDPIQEGDPLVIFQDAGDEEYIAQLLDTLNTDKDSMGIGSIPVKSPITGVVKDIKVYRTIDLNEMQPSLRKYTNKLESKGKALNKVATENKVTDSYKYKVDKLEATGKLKKAADSVVFEFYLEYEDKMSVGDKMIYLDAVKGVIKKVIPKEETPNTDFRPNEGVHSLLAKASLDARMVTSVQLVGSINKVLIELDRSIKDELGIPWKPIDELGK